MGATRAAGIGDLPRWKLEDAKARLSELVRRARAEGPQHVTVHGQDAVVMIAADDYVRLTEPSDRPSLAELFADSPLARIAIEPADERGPVRDVEL
jgi:prevent-host-death family protein